MISTRNFWWCKKKKKYRITKKYHKHNLILEWYLRAYSPLSFRAGHTKAQLRRAVKIFLHARHTGQFVRKSSSQVWPKSVFNFLYLKKSFFSNAKEWSISQVRDYALAKMLRSYFHLRIFLINFKSILSSDVYIRYICVFNVGKNS